MQRSQLGEMGYIYKASGSDCTLFIKEGREGEAERVLFAACFTGSQFSSRGYMKVVS